jgi:hypothetical protein
MGNSRSFECARFDDFGAISVGIKGEVSPTECPVIATAWRLNGKDIDSL